MKIVSFEDRVTLGPRHIRDGLYKEIRGIILLLGASIKAHTLGGNVHTQKQGSNLVYEICVTSLEYTQRCNMNC